MLKVFTIPLLIAALAFGCRTKSFEIPGPLAIDIIQTIENENIDGGNPNSDFHETKPLISLSEVQQNSIISINFEKLNPQTVQLYIPEILKSDKSNSVNNVFIKVDSVLETPEISSFLGGTSTHSSSAPSPEESQRLKDILEQGNSIKLIKGSIIPNPSQPNLSLAIPLKVTIGILINSQQNIEIYGIADWAEQSNGQNTLLFYGDRFQLGYMDRQRQNQFNNNSPAYFHSYSAHFTKDFYEAHQTSSSHENKTLYFIIGSYLVQHHFFEQQFNTLLSLRKIIYEGPEFEISEYQIANARNQATLDPSLSESTALERMFLNEVNFQVNSSENLQGPSTDSYTIFYTNHSLIGTPILPRAIGQSYIGETCSRNYRTLWTSPFILKNQQIYGRYILDLHEVSHNFGATHLESSDYFLMEEVLSATNTRLIYDNLSQNIANISKNLTKTNAMGCTQQQKKLSRDKLRWDLPIATTKTNQ